MLFWLRSRILRRTVNVFSSDFQILLAPRCQTEVYGASVSYALVQYISSEVIRNKYCGSQMQGNQALSQRAYLQGHLKEFIHSQGSYVTPKTRRVVCIRKSRELSPSSCARIKYIIYFVRKRVKVIFTHGIQVDNACYSVLWKWGAQEIYCIQCNMSGITQMWLLLWKGALEPTVYSSKDFPCGHLFEGGGQLLLRRRIQVQLNLHLIMDFQVTLFYVIMTYLEILNLKRINIFSYYKVLFVWSLRSIFVTLLRSV